MLGDLSSLTCTVGSLDLVTKLGVTIMELNIYEDMESPTGAFGDVFVVDGVNALDEAVITGTEPVRVAITSNDFNTTASFNLSLMQNSDVKPGSEQGVDGYGGGSLYHKEYTLKFCSHEFVTCQGNYVKDEFEEPCSSIARKIVTEYFPNSQFSCPDPTSMKRRMIAKYEHPLKFLNRVIDDSVNTTNKSSLYVLYNNRSEFVYETYENAFTRNTNITLTLYNKLRTSNTTYEEKKNSLMWFEGEAFYRPSRPQNKNFVVTYNMATGVVSNAKGGTDISPDDFKINLLGQPIYRTSPPRTRGVPIFVIISAENNPEEFAIGRAKRWRLAFQSHLIQNSVTFCCIGNPDIKIGSVITLRIPNQFDRSIGSNVEEQLSQKFLVTAINHKVRGVNMTPRYIMVCRAVKASFALQGNDPG